MHYKGYEVAPAAQALPSGLFAANLVIQDEASLQKRAYVFDALDYFFESDLAIAYAARWARMWIDNQAPAARLKPPPRHEAAFQPVLVQRHGRRRVDRRPFQRYRSAAVRSHRHVAHQRRPIQLPVELQVEDIRWREMRRRPVVPERDAARFPFESHRELRTRHVFPQQFEDRLTLTRRHADNMLQETRADIQRPLTGFRMHAHQWMFADERALLHGLLKRTRCRSRRQVV